MGYNTITPASGSFKSRDRYHVSLFSGIHRAEVIDVDVDNGYVKLSFENLAIETKTTIPLLGLSAPTVGENGQADFKAAGWGRYIPQKGDVLLVGFSPNGTIHAFGYSTPYYAGFTVEDQNNESTGGIGWGATSGKNLKPGDWDFKAGRGSTLFLGDKATIASAHTSLTLGQTTQDITLTAPLITSQTSQSKIRYGAARRRMDPTATQEEYLASVRGGLPAQEFTIDMRWNNSTPAGASIAYFAIGDVIEENVVGPKIMVSDNSLPVKYYFSATDDTGLITSYEEMIDSLGNLEIEALTGVSWKWTTPLAAWETTNLSTSITSTEAIDLTSGLEFNLTAGATCTISAVGTMTIESDVAMSLDAGASMDLSSTGLLTLSSDSLIQLGGVSSNFVLKGTDFISGLNVFLTAVNAAVQVTGSNVQNAAALKAIGAAILVFQPFLANYLSTKVTVS